MKLNKHTDLPYDMPDKLEKSLYDKEGPSIRDVLDNPSYTKRRIKDIRSGVKGGLQ